MQRESAARVFLKSAFGKAVGVLWNAHHQPAYPGGKPKRGVQHAGEGASQLNH
jgi:hypothetical protein